MVQNLLSRTEVLQLWHSIYNIHTQKANIVRNPGFQFADEIKSWNDAGSVFFAIYSN